MSDSRQIEFDIEALLLAALCVFVWLSLLSYDPADSVGPLPAPLSHFIEFDAQVFPANESCTNWCGWFGAACSQLMVQSLGIGSILVAVGLTVLAIWMFRVQSNYVRASRQAGWVLVIVAVTTVVALLDMSTPLAPVIGSGGYLGAMTSTLLNEHFAFVGSLILTLTVFVAGLLLSTDYVVVRAAIWMLAGGAAVATTAAAATKQKVSLPRPSRLTMRRKSTNDVKQGIQLDKLADPTAATESLTPVKIRGVHLDGHDASVTRSTDSNLGLLGIAKSMAAGMLGGASPEATPNSTPSAQPPSQEKRPNAAAAVESDAESDAEFEAEFEAEEDQAEEDEWDSQEAEDEVEVRTLEVQGATLQVRADEPHVAAEPAEPRVRAPKNKKVDEAQKNRAALAHLDDTKLPAGSEEYVLPGLDLLLESDDIDFERQTIEVRRKAKILEKTFKDFNFNVKVVEIETGPVIAQYEVELEAGLRLSKITSLADDLAIALRVPSVRIVAPIPGKCTVGIEVPNETRQVVRLREVIEEQGPKGKKAKIPLFLGKDVSGNALVADLATLPHLLIAGRTGTGKSVCLNALIASILMTKRPDEVRMLMIDPKMVELSGYARLPHLMHPVVTDMRKAEAILAWAVDKMEERYALLARAGVRHLTSYNELGREELLDRLRPESPEDAEAIPDHLPFIVIIADEMADLMMTAGKEVEQHIIRLAQKSRAVGIHLILATQKPTVDVITGLIKSNLPARISFQVASRTDSRVVLDEMGADKLLGNGDMLFMGSGTSMLLRGQGTYLSDEEINQLVDHCSTGEQHFVHELVNLKVKEEDDESGDVAPSTFKKRDELYEAAVDVVVREGRGSCSLLQRALGIGYGRAARLIDFMAEDAIVGQYNGSQAREVAISVAEWENMRAGANGASGESVASTTPPRSNKVRPTEAIEPSGPSEPSGNSKSVARGLLRSPAQTESDEAQTETPVKARSVRRSLAIVPQVAADRQAADRQAADVEYENEYDDDAVEDDVTSERDDEYEDYEAP